MCVGGLGVSAQAGEQVRLSFHWPSCPTHVFVSLVLFYGETLTRGQS